MCHRFRKCGRKALCRPAFTATGALVVCRTDQSSEAGLGKLPLTFACGPYDLEANRHPLEAPMQYLMEQRFIENAAPIEDMSWSE